MRVATSDGAVIPERKLKIEPSDKGRVSQLAEVVAEHGELYVHAPPIYPGTICPRAEIATWLSVAIRRPYLRSEERVSVTQLTDSESVAHATMVDVRRAGAGPVKYPRRKVATSKAVRSRSCVW